jgi:hypothetical protein
MEFLDGQTLKRLSSSKPSRVTRREQRKLRKASGTTRGIGLALVRGNAVSDPVLLRDTPEVGRSRRYPEILPLTLIQLIS